RRRVQDAGRRAQGKDREHAARRTVAVKRLMSLCAAGTIAGGMLLSGQQIPEPRKQFGASVIGAFEGWFANEDGSRSFLVGYFNRKTQQEIAITIGPNNQGQPRAHALGT